MHTTKGLTCIVALSVLLSAQQAQRSISKLLRRPSVLTAIEIKDVLDVSRAEWAGRTFRVLGLVNTRGPEMEMLMAGDGRPRYVWEKAIGLSAIEDYTRRPAITCEGKRLPGELVIDYTTDDSGLEWHAKAFSSADLDSFSPFYDMFEQKLASGPLAVVDGRLARALLGPGRTYSTGIARPDTGQRFWIDVDTLFPVRWEVTYKGDPRGVGYSFRYDPGSRIGPPSGVTPPTCVQVPGI